LIVPGLHGSGPEHWQSRWQRLHPHFNRVAQADWNTPDLDAWAERVAQALRASPEPVVVVAHSFGCLATVHALALGAPNVAAALLVAPADPCKFGVAKRLRVQAFAGPAILVGSSDDPWMASDRARYWAAEWGVDFICAGALGHINADSGLGDWAFGLALLDTLTTESGLLYA
jgi:predicted alpha/beta hydrolase family esterase